jgi:ABC-type glycerol-3-phosphate transport system substrate-binding protein
MKLFQKTLIVVLTLVMVLGLCSCGSTESAPKSESPSDGSEQVNADEVSYDKVVYAYATFNNVPSRETLATVEEQINLITREKIGAEVELQPIVIWDYSSQVSLALQGGEKIDVFQSLGDFNTAVSSGMALDITDMIDSDAPESKELIGMDWLAATSKDGRIYGFPTYKPIALTPMIIYRQDIVDEMGLDMSKVNSVADLTPILEQVQAAYPDMTPLAAVNTGNIGLITTVQRVDYLTDNYFSPKGVLLNNDPTVVDFYASEQFADITGLARTWYNKGLVMKDAATTTSTAAELMSSGNYFGYVAAYSYPEEDAAASLEATTGGYDLGAKMIGSAFLDTTSINALTWMVSSTTDVPDSALKFLNLTFTDEEIANLLIYGLEGRDYVKNDDGTVSYPEGQDSTTVPYTAQLSCGTLGNFFIMYPMEGTNVESLAWELEQNKNAELSVAMGFVFDSSDVATEYIAVTNVIEQYLPGLITGSVDPTTETPVFLQRLEEAGLGTIIAEKQSQLDAWFADNK